MMRRWSGPVAFPIIVAATVTALLLLGPNRLMDAYDLARMHQWYKADFRSMILAGEMPWWNPYTALGRPFLADVETATLYPPSWLVIPFGVTGGIIAMIGLHLALAVGGMQKLGEQLEIDRGFSRLAGVSFALSGALLGRIQAGQLHVFCVICLWPWLWWSALQLQDQFSRKRLAQLSVWGTVAFLAGSPQVLWCGLVVMSCFLALRAQSLRALAVFSGKLCLAGTLAAGMAAVQLIPFVELIQQGNRPLNAVGFATIGGESLQDWLTLFVPPGWGMQPNGEFNLHCGMLIVIFAAIATASFKQRNIRALTIAGIGTVLLAAGEKSFVLPWLAKWIPGFAGIRYPSRYGLSLILILNLLAFWWLDRQFREKKIRQTALTAVMGLQVLLLIGGLFLQGAIYRAPTVPANEVRLEADLKEERLPRDGAPARVAFPASLLVANAGAQAGISTLTGFNNPALARTWTSLYLMSGNPPPTFHRAEVADDVIVKLGSRQQYFSLSAFSTGKENEVRFSPPSPPRAYLSFASSVATDWKSAIERIHQGHDFVHDVLVEDISAQLKNPRTDAEGSVQIRDFSRNRIVTEYQSNSTGVIVLGEAWYPGWTVKIGESGKLPSIPVNGWMRGIIIPPGAERVIFEYRPTWWWHGVAISVLSIFVGLGLWRSAGGQPKTTIAD